MDHHNVREALAFTVPSEFGIEDVWALAVPIDNLDERTLHRHCRVRLPKAQVPIRFINVAELPRNAARKVDRHRLDAMVRELCRTGWVSTPRFARFWKVSTLKKDLRLMTCVVFIGTVEAARGGC